MLVRALAPALALALLALPSPLWAAGRGEGFGVWETRTLGCRRNLAGSPVIPCFGVLLEQRLEGLLNVAFMARAPEPGASNQLMFVGQLQPGSAAMACRLGRCEPKGPFTLALSSVSETRFDGRGLAQGLPKTWLVQGTCSLEARNLICQARALSGEQWRASTKTL
jgi:hypothetical protein